MTMGRNANKTAYKEKGKCRGEERKQPILSDAEACATVETTFLLAALAETGKPNPGKQQRGMQNPGV